VVVVASAQRLRDRALIGRLRLAASTGVAALLVGLFGVVLSRQERRERGLAEKLRLAAVTAAMRQRNERMEKLATIGTLAAGVAHEVGTPLGIISGRAEQLLARVPDGDEGEAERRGLGSILTQVDRVSSTIRQLLDFARPRAVEAEVLAPATVLHGAAVLLEHRFQQAGVLLHLPPALPLPPMKADATQLEQALINLLNNACDACVDGGEVTARVYQRADQVAFEIGDSGSGITSENLPRVLDPFFTTKKRGQGTGLGLSIVADIVKNHGGLLEIESEPGKGTTVRILLRAEAEPEERP